MSFCSANSHLTLIVQATECNLSEGADSLENIQPKCTFYSPIRPISFGFGISILSFLPQTKAKTAFQDPNFCPTNKTSTKTLFCMLDLSKEYRVHLHRHRKNQTS